MSRTRPRGLAGWNPTHGWTAADSAELDVLTHELTRGYFDHRERCDYCKPEPCPVLVAYRAHKPGCWKCENSIRVATDHYGDPCPRYLSFIAHGDTCKRCNPCPRLRVAIATVLDWREARELRSRAEELRLDLEERAS